MKSSVLSHIGLAVLRIATAGMMLAHGIPKLQKMLAGNFEFGDPIGIGSTPSLFLAVIGEVLCPIMLILGIKTRWAAIISGITMAVAAFIVHAQDAFGTKEKALLYLTVFVTLALTGAGRYSLDKK